MKFGDISAIFSENYDIDVAVKKHFLGCALGILMTIDDYHDDGGDYHDDGGYKPEQVEVVLSLKTALYGTVIATYTVASKIA